MPMRQEKIIRSMTQPARASMQPMTASPAMVFAYWASPAASGAGSPPAVVDDEMELDFVGFATFNDPPKASAAAAVAALAASGVAVNIITGDNELVTRHVCTELGLPIRAVLTGDDLQHLDDLALQARVEAANLFCRVTPPQKNRIILALKARGHTVGYLGDGINDAPSLHSADVGISVDGAVDIAKEAAQMILLKQDLMVLHDGVLEGRRTFGNIMKYIMMGTSSNFGNMFSMAGASLFLPFLPMLPTQILLNNLLYDLSELAIPMDRVDDEFLSSTRHFDMKFIRDFMWTLGPVSSLFDVLTFVIMLYVLDADAKLFRTGWFLESLATQVLVIFVIRTRHSPWLSRQNPWLAIISIIVIIVAVLLPLTPIAGYLGFVAPPPLFFALLIVLSLCYLGAAEWANRRFYQHHHSY